MARQRPGFYSTIEYIGPRPQKPKRPHFFGGWVIVVIAVGLASWFGRPLVPFLRATQQGVSTQHAELLISNLEDVGGTGDRIAAAALKSSQSEVVFDPTYYKIAYPGGDVARGKGAAADVLIRSLRAVGIDLQKEIHEDMTENFRVYPQLWNALGPDPNIDHRRVANLRRFFERKGETLVPSRDPADYRPGDVVVWSMADAESHVGIVVPGPLDRGGEPWVVHHPGASTVKWENVLFDYKIEAHFRYPALKPE
jgi:uncharacterized protein